MTPTFDYIVSDAQLIAFSRKIAQATWLAVDTEFMRERTYYAELALIQIASAEGCALVDPVKLSNLEPLHAIFTQASCVKIMHSSSQDVEVLYQAMGQMPSPVFDTQIAASFLGELDQIAYGTIVENRFDITLDKDQTRTNWLQRPLSQSQLRYAEADVLYLYELYQQLNEELKTAGREDWAQAECTALAEKMRLNAEPDLAYQRLKGLSRLKAGEQQIAKEIARWRELRAQKANLPREWVLNKKALVDIAKAKPSSMAELHAIEDLKEKQMQKNGKAWLAIIEQTLARPNHTIKMLEKEMTSKHRSQAKKLMESLRTIAQDNHIAPALIANRSGIEKLVMGERQTPLLQGWRFELAGRVLLEALEGIQSPADVEET